MTDPSPSNTAPENGVPEFECQRLLLVGTGSLNVTNLPHWISWLELAYPQMERRVVLTRSATRFVSVPALTAFEGREIGIDTWDDTPTTGSPHVELATWPDVILIYPATFHFLSRYALGLADTPVTLALQSTSAVVGVAPSVPPGATESPAYRRHVESLRALPNVVVTDPTRGFSVHSRKMDARVAVPLPNLITRVEARRRSLREAEAPC